MKKSILRVVCMILAVLIGASSVFAADSGNTQQFTVPVTLTVAHSSKHINVTLPAALPVSVLDGKVLTADNLEIWNHPDSVHVRVAGIEVTSAGFAVVSYQNFLDRGKNQIALSINGCATKGPGSLTLHSEAFPELSPGDVLPIHYSAKVSAVSDVNGINAANVIFTLRAV